MSGFMPEKVTFTTSDGVEIVALYEQSTVNGLPSTKYAVLLHMMPSTKESWLPFMEKLDAAGYSSLAIDERGHGESTMGGTLNYKNFTDEEQQAKINDVEAALEFLKSRGAAEDKTIVIGGSIGANLAIWFLTRHPGMQKGVALSPGLLYRGVSTDDKIVKLAPGQRVLLVASDDDTHRAYEGAQKLHELNPSQTELILLSGVGHAEEMFAKKPELMHEVIKFLQ